jgi:hypothetical protein
MKAKVLPFRWTFSLLVFLGLCAAQAAAPEEGNNSHLPQFDSAGNYIGICGCTTYNNDPTVDAAPPDLGPDEKARFERGVALNKEIALYGLKTLRHYKAKVVSIYPATSGTTGTEVELRIQTALVHQRGAPWCTFEQHPTPPQTLRWHWPDSRPVPACIGLLVDVYTDPRDRIQRVSFHDEASITALRKTMPGGLWELCIHWFGGNFVGSKFLVLQPDYVNLAGLYGENLHIEWTSKHGLAVSHFTPRNPAIGGPSDLEKEHRSKNWPGFPLVNVPGGYVRPGRDGWKDLETVMKQSPNSNWDVKALRLTSPNQFIATSLGWEVQYPWSP